MRALQDASIPELVRELCTRTEHLLVAWTLDETGYSPEYTYHGSRLVLYSLASVARATCLARLQEDARHA